MRVLASRSRKPVTVRPVRANAGVEAWYRARLDSLILRMHNDMSTAVIAVYAERAQPPVEGIAHDTKNPSILLRRALEKWGGLWTRKLDRLSLSLARQFARKNFTVTQTAMKAAFREAGFTVEFKATEASAQAYHAVAAEQAAETAMPGRTTSVRAGVIAGPGDPTGRFTYWPRRMALGGEMIAPGTPDDRMAFLDVRDLGTSLELKSGLEGGEKVILGAPVDLADGAKVKVAPPPKPDGDKGANKQKAS